MLRYWGKITQSVLKRHIIRDILRCLQTCFYAIIGVVAFPLILITTSLAALVRYIVILILQFKYNNRYTLAGPRDAVFAVQKYANAVTINTFFYINGKSDLEKFRKRIQTKMANCIDPADGHQPYNKLKSRLITKFGYYCWEDLSENFDIRNHVRLCPGADEPDRVYTEQQIFEVVESFVDQPLNDKVPQWEFLIVPKVSLPGDNTLRYGVIFRVLHAYMDGLSIMHYFRKCVGDEDSPGRLAFDPVNPPYKFPSFLLLVCHYIQVILLGPVCVFHASLMQYNIFQDLEENTGPKFFGCSNFEMEIEGMKRIRQRFNCSTTAILNSIVSGALTAAATRKSLSVPSFIDFGSTVAVLPYPNEDPQNRFTMARLEAPMCISDPVERLRAFGEVMKTLSAHQISTVFWLGNIVGMFPAAVARIVFSKVRLGYLLTNLPGFNDALYVDGCLIDEMYGCPPIKNGIQYGIGACSYMGKLRVCWTVEKSKVISNRQDMLALMDVFEKEYKMLEALVKSKST